MTLLDALRDPSDDGALPRLVDLVIDDSMTRPLADVVDLDLWPHLIAELLGAWARSDVAEERLVRAVLDSLDWLEAQPGRLRDHVPVPVSDGLHQLAARPWSPSRDLVLRLIDQPPVRKLLREVLLDTVTRFAQKVRQTGEHLPAAGIASGFSRLARRNPLGALAGEVVGAVSSEVERQMERRSAEFVDGALSGVIARIADMLADPSRAGDQAALRTALLDAALDLTGPELARELRSSDPAALGAVVRSSASGWVGGEGFEDQLRGWLSELVASEGTRTLGETLDELDLRDTVADAARALLLVQARRLVALDGFAAWLDSVS